MIAILHAMGVLAPVVLVVLVAPVVVLLLVVVVLVLVVGAVAITVVAVEETSLHEVEETTFHEGVVVVAALVALAEAEDDLDQVDLVAVHILLQCSLISSTISSMLVISLQVKMRTTAVEQSALGPKLRITMRM
jgi:hypothetical protein